MTTKTSTKAPDTIRIALVEDDAATLRNLKRMLATDDHCLCMGGFRTVEESLDAIPRLQPKVVLVDVNLPDGTGVDVVRELAPLLGQKRRCLTQLLRRRREQRPSGRSLAPGPSPP